MFKNLFLYEIRLQCLRSSSVPVCAKNVLRSLTALWNSKKMISGECCIYASRAMRPFVLKGACEKFLVQNIFCHRSTRRMGTLSSLESRNADLLLCTQKEFRFCTTFSVFRRVTTASSVRSVAFHFFVFRHGCKHSTACLKALRLPPMFSRIAEAEHFSNPYLCTNRHLFVEFVEHAESFGPTSCSR